MSDKQVSFGEFFDEVFQWAEDNINQATFFMEEWTELPSGVIWEDARAMPLSDGLVKAFAQDMQTYFQERIEVICTEGLYDLTLREGHSFLMAVHGIATKLGVEIDLREVDVPLCPTEWLIATGAAKFVEKKED